MPNSIDLFKPLVAGQTHGSLTVVGTGIRSISHFTQEAIGHIRDADAVFFGVPDGVTASFIRELNPNAYNLALHYGEDKRRMVTYVQMAEIILRAVREGKRVTAVFYGHPGFFVSPARRALAIARKEGHRTQMLPGISSTDYLFADLRIDPSFNGCQILDATDMLLRNRPVVTSSHVVVLQVGSVGDRFYSVKGFKNNKRAILFERLIELYGEDHPSYHYVGATFPGLDSQIIRRPLKAYRNSAVRASVHPACTLYLPPKDMLPLDQDMAEKMGMSPAGGMASNPGDVRPAASPTEYGPFEIDAIARLEREPLGGYERRTSKILYRMMTQMASNPDAEDAYRRDPATYVSLYAGLTDKEKAALTGRTAAPLHAVALQIVRQADQVQAVPLSSVPVRADAAEQNDATEQNDAAEQNEPSEQNDVAEMNEPSEQNDVAEMNEPSEQNDVAEMNEPSEQNDVAEMNEPSEQNDVAEMNEPSEQNDVAEMNEPSEMNDATEMNEPSEMNDATEMNEPSEMNDATEMNEPSEMNDATEMNEPSEMNDATEMNEPSEMNDATEMNEPSEMNDATEMNEPSEMNDATEMNEPDADLK